VAWLQSQLLPLPEVCALIEESIAPDPTGVVGDGNVIRPGFAPEMDKLKSSSTNARQFIAGLEQRERERTDIKGLKVGYNQVFGYYIEVSKVNADKVPEEYIRRQTLTNAERYIIPELKEYESLVLNARERLEEAERAVYYRVCGQLAESAAAISRVASAIARLDVFTGLADASVENGYVRPKLDQGNTIRVTNGRHPVVERVLDTGAYVPNDVNLSNDDTRVMVLTGPNMAGKSTYIRQVAIITLMAQIGCFVPASEATIGLVDRIFTRVGLQDDLATGQSTFMVEMVETAAILNQATPRSLVILDEIGRGTSTYDGLSIARSVIEHIHNDPRLGCKTLFATHYHELTQLAASLPGVRNCSVAVTEEVNKVVFLHKIVPGGADKSYGVHVAQLAGLPQGVINRAWEVLADLETQSSQNGSRVRAKIEPAQQMALFNDGGKLQGLLQELDIPNLTPLEAINKLYELQKEAQEGV
jgi:DNA mismatch repair protein MutS